MEDLTWTTAREQAGLLASGVLSCRELASHFLDRIDEVNGDLNAFVHLDRDRTLAVADAADQQRRAAVREGARLSPLHGVPVTIKELSFQQGWPSTMATRALADNVASFDAAAVAKLLEAGMVPLGKTNAPEFGSTPYTEPELFGPCRNPWNLEHTPGGSSGGAGAALAAGVGAIGLGSDGGGSIRIPASACGVFGFKPSRGRVSNGPLLASWSLDLTTRGPMSRDVRDAAHMFDELLGYVPGDPVALPPPPRPFGESVEDDPGTLTFGVFDGATFAGVAPVVAAALDEFRQLLEALGHRTVGAHVPVSEQTREDFGLVWSAQIGSMPFAGGGLEPLNEWLAGRGAAATAAELYAAEMRLGQVARQVVAAFHHDYDALIMPVLVAPPPRIGELTSLPHPEAWERMENLVGGTPMVNLTGLPAASVPSGSDPSTGLPIGIQVVGRAGEDALVLQVSRQVEEARPWAHHRPKAYS